MREEIQEAVQRAQRYCINYSGIDWFRRNGFAPRNNDFPYLALSRDLRVFCDQGGIHPQHEVDWDSRDTRIAHGTISQYWLDEDAAAAEAAAADAAAQAAAANQAAAAAAAARRNGPYNGGARAPPAPRAQAPRRVLPPRAARPLFHLGRNDIQEDDADFELPEPQTDTEDVRAEEGPEQVPGPGNDGLADAEEDDLLADDLERVRADNLEM
jgi:hypothetical protein